MSRIHAHSIPPTLPVLSVAGGMMVACGGMDYDEFLDYSSPRKQTAPHRRRIDGIATQNH